MNPQLAEDRRGYITASMFYIAVSGTVGARQTYIAPLQDERRGGPLHSGGPTGRACQWGNTYEDEAMNQVATVIGQSVLSLNTFLTHDEYPADIGCSPDGFVKTETVMIDGEEGEAFDIGVEVKCPYDPATHRVHRSGQWPLQYQCQVQGSLWVTGAHSWVFASYDPRVYQDGERVGDIYVRMEERDEDMIARISDRVLRLRDHLIDGTTPAPLDLHAPKQPTYF